MSGLVCALTPALATTVAPGTITAQPGERNQIDVVVENGRWLITDKRAPVSGYADCTAITRGVSCPPAANLTIALGDEDDEVNLADHGPAAAVDAGPGDDVVLDSPGDDVIDGGTGADRLLSGGGRDTLTFASRTRGVTIDLRTLRTSDHDYIAPFAIVIGSAGDDVIRGSGGDETFYGGPGDDRLLGSYHDDTLYGGAGNDRLFGQGHRDTLDGGPGDDLIDGGLDRDVLVDTGGGRDHFRGGPGADTIDARGGGPDRVECGAGRDRVSSGKADSLHRC